MGSGMVPPLRTTPGGTAERWNDGAMVCSHRLPPLTFPRSTRSDLLDVAYERLSLMNRHIGIADHRGEGVHHVASSDALPAPVPGHPDLMHDFVAQLERPHSASHQCLGPDLRPGRADPHPLGVLDPFLARQFGRDL